MEKQNEIAALESALQNLKEYRKEFVRVGMEMVEAYEGAVYPLDLLANAVLHRGMGLIDGFISSIESDNFICAAPLVRMHLDNLLRLFASSLVNNVQEFAMQVINGESIRDMSDKDEKKMTDYYLVKKLTQQLFWVKRVYDESCAYVHLSDKHIFNVAATKKDEEMTILVKITGKDNYIPIRLRIEATLVMNEISRQILVIMKQWIWTKSNPEEAKRLWDENK